MNFIEMPFARPFVVRMQCGLDRVFLNVYDALDFLENEWPMRSGDCYERALTLCREALAGLRSSRTARAALLAACREAGLEPITRPLVQRAPQKRAA